MTPQAPLYGMAGRPLHPIARELHLGSGQGEETLAAELAPKAQYLDDIADIDADLDAHIIEEDLWKARATVTYRHLVAEQFVLPLVAELDDGIARAQAELAAQRNSLSYLRELASGFEAQYGRLEDQDERLRPLRNIAAEFDAPALTMRSCIERFKAKDGAISLGLPDAEMCLRMYLQLLPELRRLNDRGLVEPSWLDALEELVYDLNKRAGLYESQGLISQATEGARYAQTQELPITISALFDILVTPEIEGQALFPHLRMQVTLNVPSADGIENPVALPLGAWARVAIQGIDGVGTTEATRLSWFAEAFSLALEKLRSNQRLALEIVSGSELEAREIWQLASMMEQSGLMQLYGGYDAGRPLGFQRIHDALLKDAARQKFAHEFLNASMSILCVASALVLPPVNIVTAGTCLMATLAGVDAALQLAGLAAMAETLTYVGINDSLVPRRDYVRLRRNSNMVALLTVVDVIFGALDMVGAAQLAVYGEREIIQGARFRQRALHLAQGTAEVRVLRTTDDVLAALRPIDTTFQIPFEVRIVDLYPTSAGVHRVDVLEAVLDEPNVGPLMAEAVRRWGLPYFGFRRTGAINTTTWGLDYAGGFVRNGVFELVDGKLTRTQWAPSFILMTDRTLLPRQGFEAVLQEELLHFLDYVDSSADMPLLLNGVDTVKKPLLQDSALPIIEELAKANGFDPSVLYGSTRHFFTEVRADRLMRATRPLGSGYTGIREPVAVPADWLIHHLLSLKQSMDVSYSRIPGVKFLISLVDAPNRDVLLNGLFPPHLWQDVTARAFWGLPD